MNQAVKISVVIPTLNEQENVPVIAKALMSILAPYDYEVIFSDGGSQDQTLNVLKNLHSQNIKIKYLYMSRNFGQQMALKAGLDVAQGQCVVLMDCDMQHPPELIPEMIARWQQGHEVVYTIRQESGNVPVFDRILGKMFYRLLNVFSDVPIVEGGADFVLLDRKVVDILKACNEYPLFLRGMIAWVGFQRTAITYTPNKRFAGQKKYRLGRLIELAIDGITSFSVKPLRLSIFFGGFVSLAAFIFLVYTICIRMFTDQIVAGWASVIACVLILGGIQLIILGIMGEYLGKLFMNTKGRPLYIISQKSDA